MWSNTVYFGLWLQTHCIKAFWETQLTCCQHATVIRARAGNLQGPYCFRIIIFHCLKNMPQNTPNLEYTSHLPKNFRMYCRLYVFSSNCKMLQTNFFKLLPGDITNLHQTLHTASMDSPDKKIVKEF